MRGSAQEFTSLYPESSPLPRDGNAVAEHVAVFRPMEGFTGLGDTVHRTAFGLSGFRTRS